jgi:eukaryotic-like serine/threonine-protein kinase
MRAGALRVPRMFPATAQHPALKGFEILERLGAGGAGEVFLAKSKGGRRVAIKVLSHARGRDEAFARGLAREASLCVRLTHPAIVQVRALVEDEGFAAIVFDYVDGIALSRLLRFCSALGARLPDRVAWHIVERVLSALAYAHAQRDDGGEKAPIVHRDVSPSNVLISYEGDVKLTDFGIAKMLGVSPATQFGLVKGTLGCMAPEQARGEVVDERADVYAAGLLAWRLGTGRSPFRATLTEVELLRAMRYPRLKPLGALRPDLPDRITRAVSAALEPELALRVLSAEQFVDEVRASMDVDRGYRDLRDLLHRWRGALVRHVPGALSSTDSSANHKHPTMNYDQAAALDDEPPQDSPTLETHALPGDEELWKALALQGALGLPKASSSDSEHLQIASQVDAPSEPQGASPGTGTALVGRLTPSGALLTPGVPLTPVPDVVIRARDAPSDPLPGGYLPDPQDSVPASLEGNPPRPESVAAPVSRPRSRKRLVLLALALASMAIGGALAWGVHERAFANVPRSGSSRPFDEIQRD